MSARRSSLTTPVDQIFNSADENEDGYLDVTEFKTVLQNLFWAIPPEEGEQLKIFLKEIEGSDDDITEIFKEINKSKTGLMTKEEFRNCEFFEDDD